MAAIAQMASFAGVSKRRHEGVHAAPVRRWRSTFALQRPQGAGPGSPVGPEGAAPQRFLHSATAAWAPMSGPDAQTTLERFAAGQYKPATFLERGVTLPFTTPQLLGGRIRPAERQGAELILANPAGVEGVYILPWAALPDICSPTLHDRALWAKVAQLPMLTPRSVRQAALAVAAQGFAGRAAARAAETAEIEAKRGRVLVHYQLLLELVRQGEPAGDNPLPPDLDTPANVQRRSHLVLRRLKAGATVSPTTAVEALEELAEAYESCGLRRDPTGARLPRMAAAIARLAEDIAGWGDADGQQERVAARLLVQAAGVTLRCTRMALDLAHAPLEDLWSLLHRWRVAPETVTALLARPEWALDGWDLICALWTGAEPGARGAALFEMAGLLPVIPAEVRGWAGFDAGADQSDALAGARRLRRSVQLNQDWMTGRMLDATLRNEGLRAIAA